ncbi:cytochrome c oxidase assembly factor 4 homolog, mitochondrial [Amia ocellicauda]|uniref:cytochrome c oxidase assembly factor 4 homolog, mitochondrial n=1 Tax=Amia ocellicauda TaxID=2972642 RepID=UPI0034639C81
MHCDIDLSGNSLQTFYSLCFTCLPCRQGSSMASASPHNRSRSEEQDDPVDKMISQTGCADLHHAVQDCMAEHQDWRKCQLQVQSFKDCMLAFQKVRAQAMERHRLPQAQT